MDFNKYDVTQFKAEEIESVTNWLFENGYADIAYSVIVYHQFSELIDFRDKNNFDIMISDNKLVLDKIDLVYVDANYGIPLGLIFPQVLDFVNPSVKSFDTPIYNFVLDMIAELIERKLLQYLPEYTAIDFTEYQVI